MVWVLDLPGCYINRPSTQAAVEDAPKEIRNHLSWLQSHGEGVHVPQEIEVTVVETVTRRGTANNGMTSAFFSNDRRRMTQEELPILLRRLEFSRQDLLELLQEVPEPAWSWRPDKREEWVSTYYPAIKDQAQHIAAAERWYIQKLWPVPRFAPAKNPIERLERVRRFVVDTLNEHAVADGVKVVEVEGEKWTARKVFRRLLYHERYHLGQIRAILDRYARQSGISR